MGSGHLYIDRELNLFEKGRQLAEALHIQKASECSCGIHEEAAAKAHGEIHSNAPIDHHEHQESCPASGEPRPFHKGYLKRPGGHSIFYAEFGQAEGTPYLLLHGGPGDCCNPYNAERFDLEKHHVIVFDQRGCGQSRYEQLLEQNTTEDLVEDAFALMDELGIERFYLVGASWGSTLALNLFLARPDRILGLVLRAIFLGSEEELNWTYEGGAGCFFPEAYEKFLAPLEGKSQAGESHIQSYARLIETSPDADKIGAAFRRWDLRLLAMTDLGQQLDGPCFGALDEEEHLAQQRGSRIALHYFSHHCFMKQGILPRLAALAETQPEILKGKKLYLVQGEIDMMCPPKAAYDLAKTWAQQGGEAHLQMIPDGGHIAMDQETEDAYQAAILEIGADFGSFSLN